ncbi:Hypothetical predicted protein, partial [Marmota monax]
MRYPRSRPQVSPAVPSHPQFQNVPTFPNWDPDLAHPAPWCPAQPWPPVPPFCPPTPRTCLLWGLPSVTAGVSLVPRPRGRPAQWWVRLHGRLHRRVLRAHR